MNLNMLKSIFFFVVIFIATNSIGQTKTLSFEDYNSYYWNEIEVPEGAYIKDTKNILNKFEGSYTGRYKDWNYDIKMTKYIKTRTSRGLYEDFVTFEYKIRNVVTGESFTNEGESVYEIDKSIRYHDANHIWIPWRDPISQGGGDILFTVNPEKGVNGMVFAEMYAFDGIKEPLITDQVNIILTKVN